ncbi:MAG: TolC family protein [Acidobacteriaceae bacterium]|nr:TolC family protein [Acidobacteriaceae bacterium]
MKAALYGTLTLLLSIHSAACGQHLPAPPTPLAELLSEAKANNPEISAVNHAWKASQQGVARARTLPDPKLTVQQFSVGSPEPFAGYTNSDFAYIGIGASQELPFPGKLRLRGDVAAAEAESVHTEVFLKASSIADAIKADYIQLAYLQQTLPILEASKAELDQLIQDATLHYQVGEGMQQDVLQAQIERTKLVREVARHHERVAELQAHLKSVLHRDQASADVVTEGLRETPLTVSDADILAQIRTQNPQVQADARASAEQQAKLASAKREGKPDFEVSYMYQNTDRKYRDYYMLTVQMRLPRKQRINAEVTRAAEALAQSRDLLDAQLQQQMADATQQHAKAASDAEILTDYRDGLLPQSDAAYRATLNAYAANREQFAHVISSFLALLNLRMEMLQTLADHELAVARLETLTGATLR